MSMHKASFATPTHTGSIARGWRRGLPRGCRCRRGPGGSSGRGRSDPGRRRGLASSRRRRGRRCLIRHCNQRLFTKGARYFTYLVVEPPGDRCHTVILSGELPEMTNQKRPSPRAHGYSLEQCDTHIETTVRASRAPERMGQFLPQLLNAG